LIGLQANSLGMVDDLARGVKSAAKYSDDAIDILKAKKISQVTYATLKLNTVDKNIQALLHLAAKEHRLKHYSDQFTYVSKYKKFKNGDKLLLKCLKTRTCDLENFSKLMTKSPLHVKVVTKYPHMTLGQVNIKVGTINENIMNKYFQSTGWTKIEGEVGRNGIDGLFIKKKNGVIVDVMVVESKYNKSVLQYTNNGQQMTKQWVTKKIDDLISKYPNSQDYKTIKEFVDKDVYRALLWNIKVNDDKLIISLKKVHDKSGKVVTSDLRGHEKMKINFEGNQEISIKNPNNDFHKKIVEWYKEEI
jgi:hypothetical protein